ncbi:MAG: hypothetical protein K8J31_01885 [Anaerolineae bacterium]|nr:hypothetical protein [Anaerolineae bacterium]
MSEEYPFDYGVIPISLYYKKLLQSNNIIALDEQGWRIQPNTVDFYYLLGIPEELIEYEPDSISLLPVLISVQQVDEKPAAFNEVEAEIFYGRIELGDQLDSIKGMSGGPIFAFHRFENGELRYFLTALQSRWNRYTGDIAACPVKLLGDFLETILLTYSADSDEYNT